MKGKFVRVDTICIFDKKIHPIQVEIYIRRGIPNFQISGLASKYIRESKDRLRAAIESAGYRFPFGTITINLSPAEIPKNGSLFDLPLAIGILKADGQIPNDLLPPDSIYIGELGLDGDIKGIPNFQQYIGMNNLEHSTILLPLENRTHAIQFLKKDTILVDSLLNFQKKEYLYKNKIELQKTNSLPNEYSDIHIQQNNSKDIVEQLPNLYLYPGQVFGFEALKIALAGRHHILITGSPGSGKSMLGEITENLQLTPNDKEWMEILELETSSIHNLNDRKRPFRKPHHSITIASLIGGGSNLDYGEITKSHNGILFLDELGEIHTKIVQNLREPLEKKEITITRSNKSITLPANFQLIATSNLCPCGNYSSNNSLCLCKKEQIKSYLGKLSGPILERIDIIVEIFHPGSKKGERLFVDLNQTKKEIFEVQDLQQKRNRRFNLPDNFFNSMIKDGMFELLEWDKKDIVEWDSFALSQNLGFREREKILGLARTIADTEKSDKVFPRHLYSAQVLRDGSKSIINIAT